MKKITLVVASILLLGNVAKASELNFTDEGARTRFSFEEPISFTERGIEFFVFPTATLILTLVQKILTAIIIIDWLGKEPQKLIEQIQ